MRLILSSALAAILLIPCSTRAAEIRFVIGPEPSAFFSSTTPFSVVPQGCDVDHLSGLTCTSFDLVSGPPLNVVVNPGETIYTFGEGTVSLSISGETETGQFLEGTFTGTTPSFDLSVCEGCDDLFGGGLATAEFFVSEGVGDANFFKLLGQFVEASFLMGMDGIEGDPFSLRHAFSDSGSATFDMTLQQPVPEPNLLMLGLTMAAVLAGRRRMRRRST